jgi:hypothetical protein
VKRSSYTDRDNALARVRAPAVWLAAAWAGGACSSSPGATSADAATASDVSIASDVAPGDGQAMAEAATNVDGGGSGHIADDGPNRCEGAMLPDGGSCPSRTPTTLTILGPTFATTPSGIAYGTAPDVWDVYPCASAGQALPSVTPSASTLAVSAHLLNSGPAQAWAGVGVSIEGTRCLDETNFGAGLQFTLEGDLGRCILVADAVTSPDESATQDPCRGTCSAGASCRAPSAAVTLSGAVTIPNMLFGGGSPVDGPASKELIGFRWRLATPDANAGSECSANITIAHAQLFGI